MEPIQLISVELSDFGHPVATDVAEGRMKFWNSIWKR
jgi:hypothetical protein